MQLKIFRKLLVFLLFFGLFLFASQNTYAIFIAVPLILIPVIKLLAIIFAGLLIPMTSLAVYMKKNYNIDLKKIALIVVSIMSFILIACFIIIKVLSPERPIF